MKNIIINNMKKINTDIPKEITYSETEVRELFQAIKGTLEFAKQYNLPCDIVELFEDNKKKSQ